MAGFPGNWSKRPRNNQQPAVATDQFLDLRLLLQVVKSKGGAAHCKSQQRRHTELCGDAKAERGRAEQSNNAATA